MAKALELTCSRAWMRIAAIDEKGRLVREDDGEAGAAGKTGQPGQPLLAGRDIFVLMGVGAWNEKAVELPKLSTARAAS